MFSVGSLSAGRNSSMVELSWDPETDKTGPCLDFSIFSRQSVVRVVIVGLLYLAVFYRICRVTITKPLTGSKTEGDRERWERQKETEREMGKTEGDRERWARQKETEREMGKTEGDRERWERQKETEMGKTEGDREMGKTGDREMGKTEGDREMGKTERDRERKESVCESQYHILLSQYP